MLRGEPADKGVMAVLSTTSGRLRVAIERTQAAGDDLTGAMRRGVGLAQLTREIYRAERHGTDLAVVFVDLNGLRHINQRDGHAAGDRVLSLLVERLFNNMRPYDLVVRVGGDEFVCVLPNADAQTARARLVLVAADTWDDVLTPSFSIGVASVEHGDTADALVARADGDLRAGRAG
jgi:diguanylate cyclase (GGDEF)-like protein